MSTIDHARPNSSRRTLLAIGAASVLSSGALASAPRSAGADPVFALIEAEQKAWDALSAAADDVSDDCGEKACEALNALIACPPTTAAGCLAMLDVCLARLPDWIEPDSYAAEIFASVQSYLRTAAPTA